MQTSAQLPAEHHIPQIVAMLPVASSFDRELRVTVVDSESDEHEMVMRVPRKKPAQPRKPTSMELDRLAPLERALETAIEAYRLRFDANALALIEALAAQRLWFDAEALAVSVAQMRCDAEALAESAAPLVKMIGDAQGIRANTVDLSSGALNALFLGNSWVELCEVPEDLRQLKEEVRELTLGCYHFEAVPTWVGAELVHLEMLCLNGCNMEMDTGEADCNGGVEELPALGDLHALTALTLMGFNRVETLPASFERLTSLKTLHIQDCVALQELPCFGRFTALQELTLKSLLSLAQLPASIGALAKLTKLVLNDLDQLTRLPTCFGQLTALTTLSLSRLNELEELPVSIGALTALTTLYPYDCPLSDVPPSFESLTALRTLTFCMPEAEVQDGRAFKTLACSLPALQLLQHLNLRGLCEDDVLAIGRSLRAWPLPIVDIPDYYAINLKRCWQALALVPEAADWDDTAILQHWRVQQQKVAAFASGLHARLGAASKVSSLNDVALVLIADEVLGGWSLLKLWQCERLQREAEPASSST